ncbi:hypothetical protein FRC00_006267 [Tulasnella sp. 408]|nr:hypothetical protein FRC00_006267 [Tulasnella sp. 408]
MQEFGFWLVKAHKYPSLKWLRGIRILDIILNRISRNGSRQQKMKLSVARQVLEAVTQAIIAQDQNSSASLMTERHALSIVLPLRAALSAILQTENNPEALGSILPPRHTLLAFTKTLGNICIGRDMNPCLALRLLAQMRDIPEADFELQRLNPDEDAFDILCYLPELEFARALEARLEAAHRTVHFEHGRVHWFALLLLEPLLWLSNMPRHIRIANNALVQGRACEELTKIILCSVSATWKWSDRDAWRAKGRAMACLGNIIEKMDESQMRDHVTRVMIRSVLDIKVNAEAPLSERDHATFTLQRYTAAAARCGIEPYYGEELQASGQAQGI